MSITTSFATGSIAGRKSVGGLIGVVDVKNNGNVLVSKVFACGHVDGTEKLGGLVGNLTVTGDLQLRDAFATGDTSGDTEVGGLIGEINRTDDGESQIARTYSVGLVTGSDSTGGLIGIRRGDSTVVSSFWDTDTSKIAISDGGVGRTHAEMKRNTTYSDWGIASSGASWARNTGSTPHLAPLGARPTWCPELNPFVAPTTTTTLPPPPATTAPPTTAPPTTTTIPVPEALVAPQPDPEGELPQLPPGEAQIVVDGEVINVTVTLENEDTELVLRGEGFELRLTGECSEGCRMTSDDQGRAVMELEVNGSVKVEGVGFAPGTIVYVWMFSQPRLLGTLTVAADGTFVGMLPVGDVAVGQHTLQVNGLSFDGQIRTANLGVVVAPEVGLTLPRAGANTDAVRWILALTLLGAFFVLVARRKPVNA
jgi:hypothetical protein